MKKASGRIEEVKRKKEKEKEVCGDCVAVMGESEAKVL